MICKLIFFIFLEEVLLSGGLVVTVYKKRIYIKFEFTLFGKKMISTTLAYLKNFSRPSIETTLGLKNTNFGRFFYSPCNYNFSYAKPSDQ